MASRVVKAIRKSGLSIYDSLDERPELFLGRESLEKVLNNALVGINLNYALRTRSRVLKQHVCESLGYPIPKSFKRTRPRFPGQDFDTYVQQANNLQIWNEKVEASRRYVLIRVNERGTVVRVRVVTGEVIARLDTTGTLTHKYQAKSKVAVISSQLVSSRDTPNVLAKLTNKRSTAWPDFMPIQAVFKKLSALIGSVIPNSGITRERNRGGALQDAVCKQLGKRFWRDDGQFPDVPDQLLEIKLQTATTIDLGLVCPDSREPVSGFPGFRHCDVRYAVFYGTAVGSDIRLDHVVLSTGADFFSFFRRFEGKIKNKKLQIPLPRDFFT